MRSCFDILGIPFKAFRRRAIHHQDLAATVAGIAIILHQLKTHFDSFPKRRSEVAKLLATTADTSGLSDELSIAELQELAGRMNVRTSLMHRLNVDSDFVHHRTLRTKELLEDVGRLASLNEEPKFVVTEHAANFYRFGLPLGLYDSGDVDLITSPTHIESLDAGLAKLGYQRGEDPHEELRRVYERTLNSGADLESVVWLRPLARNNLPEPSFPSSRELLERAESVASPWGKVPLLPVEYDLFYHCLHASLHSYVLAPGLRIYLDIERLIAHTDVGWDKFVQLSTSRNVSAKVAIALRITQNLLQADIPETVFRRLGSPKRTVNAFATIAGMTALYPELSTRLPRLSTLLVYGFTLLSQSMTHPNRMSSTY